MIRAGHPTQPPEDHPYEAWKLDARRCPVFIGWGRELRAFDVHLRASRAMVVAMAGEIVRASPSVDDNDRVELLRVVHRTHRVRQSGVAGYAFERVSVHVAEKPATPPTPVEVPEEDDDEEGPSSAVAALFTLTRTRSLRDEALISSTAAAASAPAAAPARSTAAPAPAAAPARSTAAPAPAAAPARSTAAPAPAAAPARSTAAPAPFASSSYRLLTALSAEPLKRAELEAAAMRHGLHRGLFEGSLSDLLRTGRVEKLGRTRAMRYAITAAGRQWLRVNRPPA